MLEQYLGKVVDRKDLNAEEAEAAMRTIMSGEAEKLQTAAFLASLRTKGETEDEIAAFARVMRDMALKIKPKVEKSVDVCGTGGDVIKTFNISTTAAFITACVVPVAKHGNRSVTSKCGSADVIEELGANLALPPRKIEECIEKIGIGFMFAPLHHQAMKNVMEVRQKLGMRTVFNILGPLTNPANATHQLIGVYDAAITDKIAKVLRILGLKKALVVHGEPGVDEVSISGRTKVSHLENDRIDSYYIEPGDFGLQPASPEAIAGGDRKASARILQDILSCKEKGAKRDVVLLNAAAAIFAADEATSIKEGFEIAKGVLEDGKAAEKLKAFIRFAQ
ncbi:anthranilate phosphoribosyltransferase [ANME-1 cluster archaeon AG-394-G06]|nr:anthranilate phosphoribosyltransferase [ANME-1 cluster archaeon AG-394-G06]